MKAIAEHDVTELVARVSKPLQFIQRCSWSVLQVDSMVAVEVADAVEVVEATRAVQF